METVLQMGHFAEINEVKRSPDGKLLLTGSKDKTVKLWDIASASEIRTFSGLQSTVSSVSFNHKGNYISATGRTGVVKVWNMYSAEEVFSLQVSEESLSDVTFFKEDFIIVAGNSDTIKLINFKTGVVKPVATGDPDKGMGNGLSVTLNIDEKLLAIGEDNRAVSVYDTETWKKIMYYKPGFGSCGGCGTKTSFSKDGKFLAKASENTNIKILEVLTGKVIAEIGKEEDRYTGIEFSSDGKTLFYSNEDSAFIVDLNLWTVVKAIPFSNTKINTAILSADATEIITGSSDNITTIYSLNTGTVDRILKGIANDGSFKSKFDINDYWFSRIARYIALKNPILMLPDDKHYLKGKSGNLIRTWNIRSGEPQKPFSGHDAPVISMDFHGSDSVASADLDGNVILWNYNTGQILQKIKWHREAVFDVRFSPDGKKLMTAAWDGGLFIWDLKTREKTGMWLEQNSAFAGCFSPDNLYVVVSKLGKSLEMIEPVTGKLVRSFYGHTDIVSSVKYLKNKKSIISSSWDGSLIVWDPGTGLMTRKLSPGNSGIYDFVIKGNDEYVIAAGEDRIIRIIALESGRVVQELSGHKTEITTLKLNKEETILISQSIDGIIKFWDLEKGKEFFEHIHIGESDWMARAPSGHFSGTAEALNRVNFVQGTETFSPEQFIEKYYRPDLLKKALGKHSTLQNELEKAPLNTVKIVGLKMDEGKKALIKVKVKDNGAGINEIKLMHNGKRVTINKEKHSQEANAEILYSDTFDLVAGNNLFTVTSFNHSRFESKPANIEIFSDASHKSATLHLLSIGINKYKNNSLSLNFAKDDASGFVELISEGTKGLFSGFKLYQLYDEEATQQNILDTLDKISHQASLHDVFIFFYAGHGSMSESKFYILPTESLRAYDEKELAKSGISDQMLQQKLQKIQALKQIIILDACHSGGSVEMLATRGSQDERAILQLARSAGIHVLASAGSEQTAKEVSDLKHGVFTYVLLKALSGEADGSPQDGKVTVYELKSYLDDQVPVLNEKYSGKAQYPYTFSQGQDFPVVLEK